MDALYGYGYLCIRIVTNLQVRTVSIPRECYGTDGVNLTYYEPFPISYGVYHIILEMNHFSNP